MHTYIRTYIHACMIGVAYQLAYLNLLIVTKQLRLLLLLQMYIHAYMHTNVHAHIYVCTYIPVHPINHYLAYDSLFWEIIWCERKSRNMLTCNTWWWGGNCLLKRKGRQEAEARLWVDAVAAHGWLRSARGIACWHATSKYDLIRMSFAARTIVESWLLASTNQLFLCSRKSFGLIKLYSLAYASE